MSWRTIANMVMDKGGTTIMAYAFLSGLIALGAVVSFGATGTAVAKMYNVISTVFVASLQPTP